MSYLFSEYKINNITLKNRIVMSSMCMYSSDDSGHLQTWHRIHYATRAVGGAGLIMQEATAVDVQGRISARDLGIWNDGQMSGYKELTSLIHSLGAKIGIQLSHSGRKGEIEGEVYAPSAIPYDDSYKVPTEMTLDDIEEVLKKFREATVRARECDYDVIEIHAAHGYLISGFLSPLTNQRNDEYGGSPERRFHFLHRVIEEVKKEWQGPLFVRISADDYHAEGNNIADFVKYSKEMRKLGVDLIDCSSGAVAPAKINVYPGYQVKYAEEIRTSASIATGAVGLIAEPDHAEEILGNERADLIFLGRVLLRNPYWPIHAAKLLDGPVQLPVQYERAYARGRTKS